MALRSHMLLAAVVLCGLTLTLALPGDIPRWCRCRRTTNNFISPRHFQKLEIMSPGAYCRQTEIIVTLKNGNTVCIDPEVKWIHKVINKFVNRSPQLSPLLKKM
ncbi:interleukin-8 isoform X2 [Sardina pilchardus]|uniref:interleukin-8 isoform X2 n=1 Tax=Sardina pilchardus TaxID=27697 RepID=UPI002E151B77